MQLAARNGFEQLLPGKVNARWNRAERTSIGTVARRAGHTFWAALSRRCSAAVTLSFAPRADLIKRAADVNHGSRLDQGVMLLADDAADITTVVLP